jgi:quinol monooxygenase YgiN
MIKHIVLWRLKSDHDEAMASIRTALEAQMGAIPGLLRVEVGRNIRASSRAAHLALYCEFADRAALEAYHRHPAHTATRAVVDPLVAEHWIVDYEP